MVSRRWTPEEDQKLRDMRADRFTYREIGEALGRSLGGIYSRGQNIGLGTKRAGEWTAEEDRKLTELYLIHAPAIEIAKALGRGVSATRLRAFKLGLIRDNRATRLAQRYGMEVLANGKDPSVILAEMREAEEKERAVALSEKQAKVSLLLDEMERGLAAGCERGFMFTAALVGGATLQGIADRVGLTRERVRQVIEERSAATALRTEDRSTLSERE